MKASSVPDMFLQYLDGHFLLGILFVLALFFALYRAFCLSKKQGFMALTAFCFLLLTVFNPLLFSRLCAIADSGASYYRFVWILPLIPLGAFFLTEAVSSLPRLLFRRDARPDGEDSGSARSFAVTAAAALLLCAVILSGGSTYLSLRNLTVPENKFTVSRAALDISQFIHDDPEHLDGDVILAPTQLMMELEAYDLSLMPAVERREYLAYGSGSEEYEYEAVLSLVLEGAQHNYEHINWNLFSLKVKYIAALTNFALDEYLDQFGFSVYQRTGDYTLYKRTRDPIF